MSLFTLTGKTALITGSARGIGLAMAEGLAAAGAHVIVNSRQHDSVDAVVEQLKSKGLQVSGAAFDVAQEDQVLTAFDGFDKAGVAIDIFMVVWNTSLQSHIPEESYSRVVAYDALGSFGLSPLGIAIAGPLAHTFGVSTIIYITGSMALVAALASLCVKSVRDLKPVVKP